MSQNSSSKQPQNAGPKLEHQQPSQSRPVVEWVQVSADAAGQRIDNFLLARLKGVPRSRVYRLLRSGEVRVNKGRARPSQRLAAGDQVRLPPLRRPEQGETVSPSAQLRERLADALLYEDDRVLVINKPAGLAVHGGSGINLGVIETLRAMRPGAELELVHRLDRDTSGCLLISKRRSALRRLHALLRDGEVDKRYLALLCGRLTRAELEVTAALSTNRVRGGERVVRVDTAAGKPSRTWFRKQRNLGPFTLVEAKLDTGRTHQIRVHAAHLGAAVAGDPKYGDPADNERLKRVGLKRLFLHAATLSFRARDDGPQVQVTAPLPEALEVVLMRLEEDTWIEAQ
ncbi:RluA family pseudouridine synthase [Halochromatium sp.]